MQALSKDSECEKPVVKNLNLSWIGNRPLFQALTLLSEIELQLKVKKFFQEVFRLFKLINVNTPSLLGNPVGSKIIIHTTKIAYSGLLSVLYLVIVT